MNILTVCICTYNRASSLADVLNAVAKMRVPEGFFFDVLVVDNRSTDNTHEIVRRFIDEKPERFRYVYEENIGLSNARNRGLRESASDMIAFLDDDAVPREGWIEALMGGYNVGDDVAVVGGQILLAFPGDDLPRWFSKPLYRYYSEREYEGEEILECWRLSDYPYGANISFRRELALSVGGFNPDLGRTGGIAFSGEEADLCKRLHQAGYRILVNPKSIVDHYIQRDRIKLKYLLNQAWLEGRKLNLWKGEKSASKSAKQVPSNIMRHAAGSLKKIARVRNIGAVVHICLVLVAETSKLLYRWKIVNHCRGRESTFREDE